jgi:hypothetical protein
MTHEEILGCSAEQLKAMTDEQLLKYYEPYLCITRPELAEKPTRGIVRQGSLPLSAEKRAKRDKVNDILQGLGIDLKI